MSALCAFCILNRCSIFQRVGIAIMVTSVDEASYVTRTRPIPTVRATGAMNFRPALSWHRPRWRNPSGSSRGAWKGLTVLSVSRLSYNYLDRQRWQAVRIHDKSQLLSGRLERLRGNFELLSMTRQTASRMTSTNPYQNSLIIFRYAHSKPLTKWSTTVARLRILTK